MTCNSRFELEHNVSVLIYLGYGNASYVSIPQSSVELNQHSTPGLNTTAEKKTPQPQYAMLRHEIYDIPPVVLEASGRGRC